MSNLILPTLDNEGIELIKSKLEWINTSYDLNNTQKEFDVENYEKNTKTIKNNEWVIIRLPSGMSKLVKLSQGNIVTLGKFGNFLVDDILNYKFGQTFEILENQKINPVNGDELINELQKSEMEEEDDELENDEEMEVEEEVKETVKEDVKDEEINELISNLNDSKKQIFEELKTQFSKDNSKLFDLGSKVQKLTTEEIEKMKKTSFSSKTGEEIINNIIKKHENFKLKTKYSQIKYLKRKKAKYSRYFMIDYLSSINLLNFYIENKELSKNLDLKEETVSFVLNQANIQPGGNYLIMDDSLGLFTYSLLERMNNKGCIYILTEDEHVNLIALERYSNYPAEYLNKMIKKLNLLQFLSPIKETLTNDESCYYFNDFDKFKNETLLNEKNSYGKSMFYKKIKNYERILINLLNFKLGNFDGLILLTNLYIPTLLSKLIDTIGGSRPIIIFNNNREILNETYFEIQKDTLPVLAPSIIEIRARYYQAIPGKLHPVMTMKSGGGYVMFGTRIFPLAVIEAIGKGKKKRKLDK